MKIKIIAILLALTGYVGAQSLSELYKKEYIQLQPVSDFVVKGLPPLTGGAQTSDPNYQKIAIAKDGSIFVSHRNKYEIWKFDNKGNFVKKIGSRGNKPGQFVYVPSVEGFLDSKYLITADYDGRINFFDLNGTYIKTIKLDYMPLAITPLKGNKFAIMGFVVMSKGPGKEFLRIIDFNTGTQKEIWQEFSGCYPKTAVKIVFPENKGMMSCGIPYTHSIATRFRLATSKEGNLIIASPKTGEVTLYSPEGNKINTFKMNIVPVKVTEADIQEQYDNAVKNEQQFEKEYVYSSRNNWTETQRQALIADYKKQLENFKDRSFYPETLPYFSSLIADSDGNILIFEFTKDETATNKFRAYSYDLKGNLIGTSSFKCDNTDVSYAPSTFMFSKGYVFAVLKNSKTPQIIKLKLM